MKTRFRKLEEAKSRLRVAELGRAAARERVEVATARYGERVVRQRNVALGEGLIGTAAQLREPVLAPDVRKDPRYLEASPEVRSELSVPLIYKGQVIGVMKDFNFASLRENIQPLAIILRNNPLWISVRIRRSATANAILSMESAWKIFDSQEPISWSFIDEQLNQYYLADSRLLKILGIFCRLKHRDGKASYSADLPRFFVYATRVANRYAPLRPPYSHGYVRPANPLSNKRRCQVRPASKWARASFSSDVKFSAHGLASRRGGRCERRNERASARNVAWSAVSLA